MAGYGIQIKGSGRALMKKGGRSFPDLTGDGKVTRADVLKGRGVFKKGGGVKQAIKTITSPTTRLRNKMSKSCNFTQRCKGGPRYCKNK